MLLQDAGPGNLLPERLRTSICDDLIPTRSGDLSVTVSIGLAYRTPEDADIEALLSRADASCTGPKKWAATGSAGPDLRLCREPEAERDSGSPCM